MSVRRVFVRLGMLVALPFPLLLAPGPAGTAAGGTPAATPLPVVAGAISGDGRYVAYVLAAGPPAPGSDEPSRSLYRRNLATGEVDEILANGDPMIDTAALSHDGRLLGVAVRAIEQSVLALVADVPAGTVTNASLPLSDLDIAASVSMAAEGRYVAFSQRSQFLGSDLPPEIYRHDLRTGHTTLASDSDRGIANGWCGDAYIDADGGFVAYTSAGDNLVEGDTNGVTDVFAVDLRTNVVQVISVGTGGPANGPSTAAGISGDGFFIPYTSAASNIVAGDTNGLPDVFLHDRRNGRDQLVSRGPAGPANGPSTAAGISADGRYVFFTSAASNLVGGDTNGVTDAFVRDLRNGHVQRVSLTPSNRQAAVPSTALGLSANGHLALYQTGPDLYLHNLATGTTTRLPH
jgi:Tol biopolymer transport system component